MAATPLESFQVQVPDVLERHAGDGQAALGDLLIRFLDAGALGARLYLRDTDLPVEVLEGAGRFPGGAKVTSPFFA